MKKGKGKWKDLRHHKNDKNKNINSEFLFYRARIDEIDRKILSLLDERAKLALKIYDIKRKNDISVFDPIREDEKIKWAYENVFYFPPQSAASVFVEIFSGTRKLWGDIRVSYLGPEGSFSHEVGISVFGSSVILIPSRDIEEVFRSVSAGDADYGVVPIENSRDGLVGETLDALMSYDTSIVYEVSFPISFAFLSNVQLDKVKRIYSHPKAIAQCSRWIKENLHHAEIIYTSSTSEGARLASEDERAGAIASEKVAEIFKIKVLEKNIQDSHGERTDFIIISKFAKGDREISAALWKSLGTGKDKKMSLCFSVIDRPGALFHALEPLAKRKINMKKIHSRPDRVTKRYNFFIEIECARGKNIDEALSEMGERVLFMKIFGEYPYRKM